jgi:hypothetical protein
MSFNPAVAVETYNALKERLLADFPELVDDPDTLRDTLEGISDVHEIVGWLGRRALEDEANAVVSKAVGRTYQDRGDRLERRSKRLKATMLQLMKATDLPRIDRPEMTITRSSTPERVIVTDVSIVPDMFVKTERTPKLNEIKAHLRALPENETVNWATLSEPGETLRITR